MQFAFGSGILTGLRTDASGTQTPVRFGALQSCTLEFDGETKSLFATQQYPIDTARGKTKISGKAKSAEIKGREYNDLFFGQTLSTGSTKYALNESTTTTNTTVAPTYTVANAGSTPFADQGVFYVSNGNQLTAVSSGPSTVGQYAFDAATGVFSFSTFDNNTGLFINYTYHVASGFTIGGQNPLMGNTPRFQATFMNQFENNQLVLFLYACVSSRLTFPSQLDDYWINDFDFDAFADSSGQVFDISSTN